MDTQEQRCVMVLEEGLSPGLAVNTAGVLSFTLGREMGEAVGQEVTDASGHVHLGIIEIPIPILRADRDTVRSIRREVYGREDVVAVDFTNVAQSCKTYNEYIEKMAAIPEEELEYLGVALYGHKKLVNRLTGSLPLLR